MPPPAARPRPTSVSKQPSLPTLMAKEADVAGLTSSSTSRPLSRSSSVNRFLSAEPARAGKISRRQTSLPPNAGLPLQRSSSVSAATVPLHSSQSNGRLFKRSLSRSSMLLESPPGSDDEGADGNDGDLVDRAFAGPHFRRDGSASASLRGSSLSTAMFGSRAGSHVPASPTPSVASLVDVDQVANVLEGDDDGSGGRDDAVAENEESLNAVAELRPFAPGHLFEMDRLGADPLLHSSVVGQVAGRKRRIARSSSLPIGQFALASGRTKSTVPLKDEVLPLGARPLQDELRPVEAIHTSLAAAESAMGSAPTSSAVETRNKNVSSHRSLACFGHECCLSHSQHMFA